MVRVTFLIGTRGHNSYVRKGEGQKRMYTHQLAGTKAEQKERSFKCFKTIHNVIKPFAEQKGGCNLHTSMPASLSFLKLQRY